MRPDLDDPARVDELRRRIRGKPALRAFYGDVYRRFARALEATGPGGLAIELGSGGGFASEVIPGIVTSDVLPYAGLDVVFDATHMPFGDGGLRFVGMLNVLHHVADTPALFGELTRCLRPGGRVLIVDHFRGVISDPVFRYLHHEPYHPERAEWRFPSSGPLSSANAALAWMIFVRDRTRFEALFPHLRVARVEPHSPLSYWLSGGLKPWSLVPGWGVAAAQRLDRALVRLSEETASFVDIELERV